MPFGTVTLNDGNQMPTIAFGSGSVWKGHDVSQYVEQAIEEGFSHLDTAAVYGNEESVGAGIRESGISRSELFVATKWDGGDVRNSVESSLAKVDAKDSIEQTWKHFEAIKKDGLSKSIGVSNFSLKELEELVSTAHIIPAVNQISLNPYNYADQKALLEYCASHGIAVEAYSSLTPITKTPGGPVDKPVAAAAARLGITPTQAILKWVRSKGVVIVTTSSSKEHLREYLAVEDIPSLTVEEIAAIEEAGAEGFLKRLRLPLLLLFLSLCLGGALLLQKF